MLGNIPYIVIVLIGIVSHAMPVFSSSINDRVDLLAESFVYEDKGANLSLEDVVSLFQQGKMEPFSKNKRLAYGYTSSTIWVRAVVKNPSDKVQRRFLGSIRPELSTMNLYWYVDDELKQAWVGGASVPPENRSYNSRLMMNPVDIPANSEQVFYFQLRSKISISMVLESLSVDQYIRSYQLADATHALYVGLILSLSLYSLFYFITLKELNYLFYSLFGLMMIMSDIVYSGFFEYWGIDLVVIKGHGQAMGFVGLTAVAITCYVITFFRLKETSKPLYYIGLGLIAIMGSLGVLQLITESQLLAEMIQTFQGLSIIYLVWTGVSAIRQGRKDAIYFLIGWGVFAVAIIIWLMGNEGVIDKNYLTANAPLIGNAIELLFTGFAQSIQFNQMKNDQFQKRIAEEESSSLRTLVHVVCHDIANPLSIISGSHSIAMKTKKEEVLSKSWDRIGRASQAIENIISQVRRMQAMHSGKFKLNLVPVSLESAMSDVLFTFEERAKAKGVRINIASRIDFQVLADHVCLVHDVMNNIISNAIKFSEKGQEITVAADKIGAMIHVKVKDQGIGMPKTIQEDLFSKHKSTSRLGTDKEVGTGFGMPLAKSFMDKFGGEILVTSEEKIADSDNHGTTFELVFKEAA